MSDQLLNKDVVEESQVRAMVMALQSPTSSSDKLLSRIAILLFVLVVGLLKLRELDLHHDYPGGISRNPI
jgi:hypothetical protein